MNRLNVYIYPCHEGRTLIDDQTNYTGRIWRRTGEYFALCDFPVDLKVLFERIATGNICRQCYGLFSGRAINRAYRTKYSGKSDFKTSIYYGFLWGLHDFFSFCFRKHLPPSIGQAAVRCFLYRSKCFNRIISCVGRTCPIQNLKGAADL